MRTITRDRFLNRHYKSEMTILEKALQLFVYRSRLIVNYCAIRAQIQRSTSFLELS